MPHQTRPQRIRFWNPGVSIRHTETHRTPLVEVAHLYTAVESSDNSLIDREIVLETATELTDMEMEAGSKIST